MGVCAALIFYLAFALDERHAAFKALAIFFGIYMLLILAKSGIDYSKNCQYLPEHTFTTNVYGSNFTDGAVSEHWHDGSPVFVYSPQDNTPRVHLFQTNTTTFYKEYCQNNAAQIGTAQAFYKVVLWFFRLAVVYLIGFVLYIVGEYLKKVNSAGGKP